MAKAIEDQGNLVAVAKPLKLRRYKPGPGRSPDAGESTDALIVINDQSDGIPRGRLALSNGATWDELAYREELDALAAKVNDLAKIATGGSGHIDLTPLVREAVSRAIAEMPQPAVKLIAPPADVGGDSGRLLAKGLVDISDHLATVAQQSAASEAALRQQLADLEGRIRYIEQHALARAKIA